MKKQSMTFLSRQGTQIIMDFKSQQDAELTTAYALEKTIKNYYRKESDSSHDAEKYLIAAMFHQALLDCFSQEYTVKKAARKWLLRNTCRIYSAIWYAELAGMEYELSKIRKFLLSKEYKKTA